MISYRPATLLERAVLEAGRFALTTDTAGREVVAVGHRRLPKVVLQQKADDLHGLMQEVATSGGRVFVAGEGDPWEIREVDEEPEDAGSPTAAEEYLVMGLRPLVLEGRPVRVAVRREVVRLLVLPWAIPARTVQLGGETRFVVTGRRSLVGDWQTDPEGRQGVVVGVSEMWLGVLERRYGGAGGLVLRCDVPVPWVGDEGLAGAVPTAVGVYAPRAEGDPEGPGPDGGGTGSATGGGPGAGSPAPVSWLAKLPVVLTEGDVVRSTAVPGDLDVGPAVEGPWEAEALGPSDFPMSSLT